MTSEPRKIEFSEHKETIVRTRLTKEDFAKILYLAQSEGKKLSDFAREGLLEFIDRKERGLSEHRDDVLASAIKAQANRIAGLLASNAIDGGIVIYLLHYVLSARGDDISVLMKDARNWGVKRTQRKLSPAEVELKEFFNKLLD
jgi:hypothetical protein